MAVLCCSTRCFFIFILLSAVPIAFIIHLETSTKSSSHVYQYRSTGWLRECTKWDAMNSQFILSFIEGGFGVVPVPENYKPSMVLEETPMVRNVDLRRNSTVGFVVDHPRNRVVAAITDALGQRFSAVAAYDLTTWDRIFLTKLSGPDEKTIADDVAVDSNGNAYITDLINNKIWKVGPKGEFLYTINSPIFTPSEWYNNLIGLNGIVYNPNGYLLVVHSLSGKLFKVNIAKGDEVKLVYLGEDSLKFGDGLGLLSPTKLVVAGNPSRLVESVDDWETAKVVSKTWSAAHRFVTSVTIKDDKAYLNHLFGLGYPNLKHVLVEASFG